MQVQGCKKKTKKISGKNIKTHSWLIPMSQYFQSAVNLHFCCSICAECKYNVQVLLHQRTVCWILIGMTMRVNICQECMVTSPLFSRSFLLTGLSGQEFSFLPNGDGPSRYRILNFRRTSSGSYEWATIGYYKNGHMDLVSGPRLTLNSCLCNDI